MDLKNEITSSALNVGVTILCTFVLPWLATRLGKWILALKINADLKALLFKLNEFATVAVADVAQEAVRLKSKAPNKKLSDAEAQLLRDMARTKIMAFLGEQGKVQAEKHLGDLNAFIDSKIEAEVKAAKPTT